VIRSGWIIVTEAEARCATGRVADALSPATGVAASKRGRIAIMGKGKRLVYQSPQATIRVNNRAISDKTRRHVILL
jgi:hypothetical protein